MSESLLLAQGIPGCTTTVLGIIVVVVAAVFISML